MIACPAGYSERRSGETLHFLPPDYTGNPLVGVLRYSERVTPLHSLHGHLHQVAQEHRGLQITRVGRAQRVRTAEGEYGGLLIAHGHIGEVAHALIVGAIFAEEFSTRLDVCLNLQAADNLQRYQELVYDLMVADVLTLGARLRRPFFRVPAGWHVRANNLSVSLYPPSYPQPHACLIVEPADPRTDREPAQVLAGQDHRLGLSIVSAAAPVPLGNDMGLVGQMLSCDLRSPDGMQLRRYMASLRDEAYRYSARLEVLSSEDNTALHDELRVLIASIEPLGQPLPTVKDPREERVLPNLGAFWAR
jgi:hypothetical protein